MSIKRALLFVTIAVLAACRDKKPVAVESFHVPGLLGMRTEPVIQHFMKTCRKGGTDDGGALRCSLATGDYSVGFDDRGRIDVMEIFLSTDVEILETFDRVFVPILPDETREIVRSALIRDLGHDGKHRVYTLGNYDTNGAIFETITTDESGTKNVSWTLFGI